ncbi:monocarboxylate transporter 14-like isoform X3 [Frankliniella occidentalis]|nr:monocarboxylate transporter 14-like isoform X3 [Frankliniella occidentalis]
MVNLIADGITFSFGVLYVEFLNYFNEGKAYTSWIGSLFMAMPLLSGPVASFLTDRYGCRRVTIAGALLASAGFVASSFTNSLEMLFLTFGVIAGFGLSLCYVAAVVIVAYYFDSKRSLATGLSVCGSGIGTFVFAPLTQKLLKEYGWRGTVLILAGLLLNLCVCGALMRDLEWTTRSRAERAKKAKLERGARRHRRKLHHAGSSIKSGRTNGSSADTMSNGISPYICDVEQLRKLLKTPGTAAFQYGDGNAVNVDPASRMCSSLVNLPTFVRNKEKVPIEVLELLSTNSQIYKILQHNYPNLLASRSFSDSGRLNDSQHQVIEIHPVERVYRAILEPPDENQEIIKDIARDLEDENKADCITQLLNNFDDTQETDTLNVENTKEEAEENCSDKLETKSVHLEPNLEYIKKNGLKIENINCPVASCNGVQSITEDNVLNANIPELTTKAVLNNNVDLVFEKNIPNGIGNGLAHRSSLPVDSENQQVRKLPTSYLRDLRVHRHSLTYRGAMLNINRYRLRASSCPDIYRNSMTTIAKEKDEWYAGLWELWYVLADMLDFSHFLDMRFSLFALSNFLLYAWYDVPYVYLMDNAIQFDYTEEDASFLFSVIGIMNMIGEIVLGWMGDRPWANPGLVYAGCMGGCGLVVALIPSLTVYSYRLLSVVSGGFGLLIAANYSLTSIILVELISIERFTNAYGLLLLVQGIANLVGPPMAGYFYDLSGKYDLSFYLAGLFIAISGLLLLVLPALEIYRSLKQKWYLQKNTSTFITPTINDGSSSSVLRKIFVCCTRSGKPKPATNLRAV